MSGTLKHRGPDDSGVWVDADVGLALGFRRLSVLDTSRSGHQPMVSACGRWVTVFNGEIYNHKELRKELEAEGTRFQGSSDTEVMLAVISQRGLSHALKAFNGMFAMALWDRQERQLHLVRDRLGEKPLYYGWADQCFLFGSELRAFKVHPAFRPSVNREAAVAYLRYNCVPAPYSIYEDFFKLPPASVLTLKPGQSATAIEPYWSLQDVVVRGVRDPFPGDEKEAVDELDRQLRKSIRQRMISDVPLGAFLSGGIDSSLVVALMQVQSPQAVQTFSIGSTSSDYDESRYAQPVAEYLRTSHTALTVTPNEAMDAVHKMANIYDEPFADPSQIPAFLVSRLARQKVIVSLSGDGGDEIFGGYNRYAWGPKIRAKIHSFPRFMRKAAVEILSLLTPQLWDDWLNLAANLLPRKVRFSHVAEKAQKVSSILEFDDTESLYLDLVSYWKSPQSLILGASENSLREQLPSLPGLTEESSLMMYWDTLTYLPNDILVKLDRASMAVSLEARAPFLDHHLVELAWRLPLSLKIRDGFGKWILRRLLSRYLPAGLIDRPKMGFAVPLDSWLRGPLKDWAATLIDDQRLRSEGFFDPRPVREKWNEHQAVQRNWHYPLWGVLMFQAWLSASKTQPLPQDG
jgi:asparagine synthase (glutamine-hydrolysing)